MKTLKLVQDKFTLIVPETSIRGIGIHPQSAYAIVQLGGAGTWRANLDLPNILEQGLADLRKLIFENSLGYDVFCTGLKRMDEGGGNNGGAAPNPPAPVPPTPTAPAIA
ncbi:MAG: hypothetical protein WCJ07_11675 [Verrucomicrobiota bacterium]